MTTLGVVDIHVQDGTAWCQVTVPEGSLRVGESIIGARDANGATTPLQLVVDGIETVSGQVIQVVGPTNARVRMSGPNVELLRWATSIEVASSTTSGYGQPTPAAPAWTSLDPTARPELVVQLPERRSRLTVAFRVVLVIPQLVAVFFLAIAAAVIAVIGWFGALFTARLPEFAQEYLSAYLAYTTRVSAYAMLLVDHYPPFRLRVDDYPVRLVLPSPGRLNRAAVLFRIVLLIPVIFFAEWLSYGWTVLAFFFWLTILVLGRSPVAVSGSTTAVLRFSMRYQAYALMLTSRYPAGLYGEPPPMTQPAPGQPPAGQPYLGQPYPMPDGASLQGPPGVRLVLSRAAKGFVTAFIVLGIIGWGTQSVIQARANRGASNSSARQQLERAYVGAPARIDELLPQMHACKGSTDTLDCVSPLDDVAVDLGAFDDQIRALTLDLR